MTCCYPETFVCEAARTSHFFSIVFTRNKRIIPYGVHNLMTVILPIWHLNSKWSNVSFIIYPFYLKGKSTVLQWVLNWTLLPSHKLAFKRPYVDVNVHSWYSLYTLIETKVPDSILPCCGIQNVHRKCLVWKALPEWIKYQVHCSVPYRVFCILGSEAFSSAGSEESESSSYSDWESLDETEDPGVLQSVAAATFRSYENKVSVRNLENLNTK
jgi:hypothetical protein